MRNRSLICSCMGLAIVVLANWMPAVAQINTGGIVGRVTDQAGEALPGVLITVQNPEKGFERAVTSNAEGVYRIIALPPAVYLVQAKISGYGAPLKSIPVNVGQMVPVDFTMDPEGGLREKLTVTVEAPLVNTTKTEVSTLVTEKEIRAYPLIQRDFNDLAQLAPGVKQAPSGQFDPTKKEQIYQPWTAGGSSGRNVNISIDGADNNDNVVGFFVQGFSVEAIQEFEVIQDQYKAEYGRSLGGVVNVVTKSGTNDFGGSAFGYFFNESFRAKNYAERLAGADKTESDREYFGFTVGGPIVENKLFYFLSLERRNDQKPVTLSDILTDQSSGLPARYPFSIASPGTTVGQDFERDLWSARLDWNVSPDHQIWLRWSRDNTDALNDQGEALVGPENQGDSKNDVWSAVLNWQWMISGNMINELKIHRNDFENRIVSKSVDPILTLSYDNFDIGRNINTPQATFQNKFQIRDDFTWIRGRHSYKAGLEAIRVEMNDSYLGPAMVPALQFVFNPGVEPRDSIPVGDNNGNGFDDGMDVIDEVAPINPGFIPGTKYEQYGFYFQDDWEFNDRWRFNLGVRFDLDRNIFKDAEKGINRDFYNCFADPTDDAACGRAPGSPDPIGFDSFEEKYPQDQLNISPRLGFIYRVGGEDRDVLRGSWGLFYDKLIDNLVIFMRQNLSPYFSPALPTLNGCDPASDPNTGLPTWDCSNSELLAGTLIDPRLPPLPVDFTLNNWLDTSVTDPNGMSLQDWYTTLTSILGPGTFDDYLAMPSPDWKTPYTSAFSFGWGHTFSPRLAVDTNLIYRRGFNQLRRQDYRGRRGAREAPNSGGALILFTTDGKTEYVALQTALRGRWPNFDFGINVNVSQALGTQDNAGTIPTDGGPLDIFEGGNIRYTGGNIDKEWGKISGDQAFYTILYGVYRLPMDFQTAAQIIYGTKTAFQGFAGVDINQDGFNSGNEYVGNRGGALGDDLFVINWRGSKFFSLGAGMTLEVYADVFNLLNRVNHGLYVIHQQLTIDGTGNVILNPDYGRPTGDTLINPRTVQFGVRYTF